MTSDPYRGVRTISYDISDHIAKLDSDSAVVSFGYLASGVKMSRKVEMSSDTVLLEYVGNVVMEDGKMKYLLIDGGYIDFTSGTPVYMYYFKDHLGSNRVVASRSGSVEQVNRYYPYGLSFPLDSHASSGSDSSVPSAGGDDQPWKYSGNELMSLGGLSVYDFNARTYDQSLGRFLSIDPLAEKYYSVSPYAFCSNNPVNFVDPDGMDWYIFSSSGQYREKVEKEGQHRIAIHSIEKLESGETYDNYRFINFADPENDPQSIDNGEIDELVFVGEDDILSMMNEAGAFESSMLNFITQGHRQFDYSYSVIKDRYNVTSKKGGIIASNQLFLPEGDHTAHNLMNFGNYLWGATGYVVGLNYDILQGGAHLNSMLNPGKNGYVRQWDSKDDQRSIRLGIFHAYTHKYRRYRK